MVNFSALLDADVGVNIATFLPCRAVLVSFVALNKKCLQATKLNLLVNRDVTDRARPLESSHKRLSNIFHYARLMSWETGLWVAPPDVHRQIEREGMRCLALNPANTVHKLTLQASIYTHWDGSPARPDFGLYDVLLGENKARLAKPSKDDVPWGNSLEEDCKYWKTSRVQDDFIFLFERPDGSVLVSEDCKRVYLALGHSQSIGDIANFAFRNGQFVQLPSPPAPLLHTRVVGVMLALTLLPWEGRIVHDGLLRPVAMATAAQTKRALQAYLQAVDTRTLITKLVKVPPISRTPMVDGLTNSETTILRRAFADDLAAIHAQTRPTNGPWVLRRADYTEKLNPSHCVFVMEGGGEYDNSQFVTSFMADALEPSVQEYMFNLKEAIVKYGKPSSVKVDVESVVATLKALLEPQQGFFSLGDRSRTETGRFTVHFDVQDTAQ